MPTTGDNEALRVVTRSGNKLYGTISFTASSKQILIIKTAKLDYSLMALKASTIEAFSQSQMCSLCNISKLQSQSSNFFLSPQSRYLHWSMKSVLMEKFKYLRSHDFHF